MTESEKGWVEVRGVAVHCHLLYDRKGAYLIDGGFLGGVRRIGRALDRLDRSWPELRAIFLTHGHFDHACNVAKLAERSGARVYAPAADREHVEGRWAYRGVSRFCGWAEAVGRTVLGYRVPKVTQWLEPGDLVGDWGGLEAIDLPGHTVGHTGYYSRAHRLLFAGDLFVNFLGPPRRPPPWFSTDRDEIRTSIDRAADLDLDGVLLAHSRRASAAEHLKDLRKLQTKFGSSG